MNYFTFTQKGADGRRQLNREAVRRALNEVGIEDPDVEQYIERLPIGEVFRIQEIRNQILYRQALSQVYELFGELDGRKVKGPAFYFDMNMQSVNVIVNHDALPLFFYHAQDCRCKLQVGVRRLGPYTSKDEGLRHLSKCAKYIMPCPECFGAALEESEVSKTLGRAARATLENGTAAALFLPTVDEKTPYHVDQVCFYSKHGAKRRLIHQADRPCKLRRRAVLFGIGNLEEVNERAEREFPESEVLLCPDCLAEAYEAEGLSDAAAAREFARQCFFEAEKANYGPKGQEEKSPMERIGRLCVTVTAEELGEVLGEISSRRGNATGMEPQDGGMTILALVPELEMEGFEAFFQQATAGKGRMSYQYDHDEPMPKAVAEREKKKQAAAPAVFPHIRQMEITDVQVRALEGVTPQTHMLWVHVEFQMEPPPPPKMCLPIQLWAFDIMDVTNPLMHAQFTAEHAIQTEKQDTPGAEPCYSFTFRVDCGRRLPPETIAMQMTLGQGENALAPVTAEVYLENN